MLYRYRLIILLVLGSITHTTMAQNTISGEVLDNYNKPLEFANIVLITIDTDKIVDGVITNENGKFMISFDATGTYKIIVSFVGFDNWEKIIDSKNSLDLGKIVLRQSNELEEVVVTAKKPVISKKEDKLVFNVQNSPLKTDANGIEILQQTPLVWVEENSITMRNENVTVLVNGQKVRLSGVALANYIKDLKSENIKSIEVQTSKSSVMDAESSGGIVNIVLLKTPIGFNGSLNTAYKINGQNYYNLYEGLNFNYGAEKWNVYGRYNFNKATGSRKIITDTDYSLTQNHIKTTSIDEYDESRHNYQVGFVTQLGKNHQIGMELFNMIWSEQTPVNANLSITNAISLLDNGTVKTTNSPNNNLLTGVFNYTWNMKNDSKLKFYADYLKQTSNAKSATSSTYELGYYDDVFEKYDSKATAEIIAYQSDYTKTFDSGLKLETGLKYTHTDKENSLITQYLNNSEYITDSDRTTSLKYKECISAGHISLSKKFSEKNYFKVGLRLENTDLDRKNLLNNDIVTQNYTDWFPSLYFSREIAENQTLSVSYSRSLRRPAFRLLSNEIIKINDFNFIVGNPDLRPEFSNTYELSYQFGRDILFAYYKKTKDDINRVYFVENDIAYLKSINTGSQVEYGLDYNSSKKINDWWRLSYNLSLFNRKSINEQNQSDFEKVSFSINLSNNIKINNTTNIDILGRYIAPRTSPFYYGEEYYTVIAVFKKSFFDKKLNLKISMDDVFNTLVFKSTREYDDYITFTNDKPLTRKVYFGLTYNFSNNNKSQKKKNTSKNDAGRRLR